MKTLQQLTEKQIMLADAVIDSIEKENMNGRESNTVYAHKEAFMGEVRVNLRDAELAGDDEAKLAFFYQSFGNNEWIYFDTEEDAEEYFDDNFSLDYKSSAATDKLVTLCEEYSDDDDVFSVTDDPDYDDEFFDGVVDTIAEKIHEFVQNQAVLDLYGPNCSL